MKRLRRTRTLSTRNYTRPLGAPEAALTRSTGQRVSAAEQAAVKAYFDNLPLGFWMEGNGRTMPLTAKSINSGMYASFVAGARRELRHSDEDYASAYVASAYAFRTINAVANDIANIPWAVYHRRTGKEVPDHPLTLAIHAAKTQYKQDLFALWQKALRIFGEAYIEPCRNLLGWYTTTRWLNPLAVEPWISASGVLERFDYMPAYGGITHFAPDELVFDKIDSIFDDVRGQSLLAVVLTEINIDRDIQRYTKAFFLNDARPGGILTGRQGSSLTQNDLQGYLEILKEQTEGVGGKYRPIVLPAALEWQQVQQGPDTTHLAVEENVRRRICMALDVPISVAGAWDDARYQSAPEQRRAYYEGTIRREWTRLAGVINNDLMLFFDDSGEHELRPDFTEIMALIEDQKLKTDLLGARLQAGGITLNEYRAELQLPTLPGGDVLLLPSGVVAVPKEQLHRANEYLQGMVQPATQINFSGAAPGAAPPAVDAKQKQPVISPARAAAKAACIALSLANNADLIALQRRVKEFVGLSSVEWSKPDDFHVTLIYFPSVTPEQAELLKAALQEVELSPMQLRIGSLRTFDNLGNWALHFRLRSNSNLFDLHENLYQRCEAQGLQTSAYSIPEKHIPHVTIGYAASKPPAVTFEGKITVAPVELLMWLDEEVVYRRKVSEPQPVSEAALDELSAWQKKISNKGLSATFVNRLIRDEVADGIRAALQEVERTGEGTVKAIFEEAQARIASKAIQSTRLDFEGAFADAVQAALAGNVDRRRFGNILRQLIRTYGSRAYRDGLKDGGVEAEPDEAEQEEIANLIGEQSAFVSGLGEALYRGETVTEALAEQKPEMWWNKSILPFYTAGLASANGNQMMEFAGDDGDESCATCQKLKGQRHRLKDWVRRQLVPAQDTDNFECGGWRCQHRLVQVNGAARGNW